MGLVYLLVLSCIIVFCYVLVCIFFFLYLILFKFPSPQRPVGHYQCLLYYFINVIFKFCQRNSGLIGAQKNLHMLLDYLDVNEGKSRLGFSDFTLISTNTLNGIQLSFKGIHQDQCYGYCWLPHDSVLLCTAWAANASYYHRTIFIFIFIWCYLSLPVVLLKKKSRQLIHLSFT